MGMPGGTELLIVLAPNNKTTIAKTINNSVPPGIPILYILTFVF